MRIISGKLKKSKIISPGKLKVRPTSYRAKEMIFSTLESILIKENTSFSGSNVLDGFCGTGSLGIETISRGAKFIEKHLTLNKASQSIRDHTLSITPDEFRELVDIGREISKTHPFTEKN